MRAQLSPDEVNSRDNLSYSTCEGPGRRSGPALPSSQERRRAFPRSGGADRKTAAKPRSVLHYVGVAIATCRVISK
ncbi:hypothetical protein SKAU_G00071880 [Synaphobranchus kaupii]|uniref:Uncharacterized protein n=1 Tax=Synaphobranchus kaupii TaxID=118154 RepID=A0A9Q1JBD5_SYNKA|nr:hypothetical protein SKAU_G00071880 [Synaphobranchus kaupii]